jgi:stress response protein YsnF
MAGAEPGTVVGVFTDRPRADRAVTALLDAGVPQGEIAIVSRADAAGGPALQGGPVLASGPLVPTNTAEADSGLAEALARLGLPAADAGFYNQELLAGRAIVAVRAPGHSAPVREILGSAGARAVRRVTPNGDATIELREEELQALRQRVQVGEIVIRKHVVVETRTIEVPVAHEEVVIERRSLDHQAVSALSDANGAAVPARDVDAHLAERLRHLQPGDVVRVPVMEEEVVIQKRPVVVEEIAIGKRAHTETHRISEAVRREQVRIERQGDVTVVETGSASPVEGSGGR